MSDFLATAPTSSSAPPPATAPAARHKVGDLVRYTYESPAGTATDVGIVVAVEDRTHPNLDGSTFDEGPHVIVAWLRDLSHPLPEGLFTSD